MRRRALAVMAAALILPGILSCCGGEQPGSAAAGGSRQGGSIVNQNDFFAGSNLQRYVGRTVAEFVADLPERYEEVYPIDEPPGKLNGFALRFHDGRVVDVLCSDLKHVQRFSEQRRWDFEAFKKETISEIVESRPDTGREGE